MAGKQGELNAQALSGFAKAAAYDQNRPSYPSEAVDVLLDACRVAGVEGAKIIDLAAGTGIFTKLLAARPEQYEVLAVEPHGPMKAELEKKQLRNVEVKDGLASKIPADDESADAVIAAQAFHWFSNMDSLKDIHRVLKMHGVLGMTWNIEDYNQTRDAHMTTPWESKLHDLIWTFDDAQPRYRHAEWRKVFDEQLQSTPLTLPLFANPLFSLPLAEQTFPFTVKLTKEALWDRFSTLSQIARLEGEEREQAKKTFDEAVGEADADEEGRVEIHGVTVCVWTSKVPA